MPDQAAIHGIPEELREQLVDYAQAGRFVRELGIEFDELSPTRVRAHLEADSRHHQPFGIVHGGVHCSLVETLASVGGALAVWDDGLVPVGVANSTDFLRPHRTGRLDAAAEPIHVGRTQQLWQVVITRASDDKPVARGQVRLQNVPDEDGVAFGGWAG